LGELFREKQEPDFNEALKWLNKSLIIKENKLGTNHISTAFTYFYLGGVYKDLGKYDEAIIWYSKALLIRERIFGKKHPETAKIYYSKAFIYQLQKKFKQALLLYENAIIIFYFIFDHNHSDILNCIEYMRSTYLALGHTEQEFSQYLSDLLSNPPPPPTQED
jgi:tetratricopeptide (TPR) repeat protein